MRYLFAMALVLCLTGCYHATIDTGLTPSNKVIHKPFASSWIYGLIPPPIVQTAAECPGGVARVETQHTIPNTLVGWITFGIYTPIDIMVTCAEGNKAELPPTGAQFVMPDVASTEEVHEYLARAARASMITKQPVFVQLPGEVTE